MRAIAPMAALTMAALLSGCAWLGLEQNRPDEFRVIARAPLEMPPDYNLRPPQPGSPRPQELDRENRATASVFGAASGAATTGSTFQSPGEVALLVQAGADQADGDIRAIVDREQPGVVVGSPSLLDRILGWTGVGGEGGVTISRTDSQPGAVQ